MLRLQIAGMMPALLALTAGLASARTVAAAAPDPLERGKAIFQSQCARCHGDNGADVTSYPNIKSLVDVTQRMSARDVIEKSRGFASLPIEGEDAAALYAFLGTLRSGGYANPDLLVETSWVEVHLKDPAVRVVDLRAAAAYSAGHIPGAVLLAEGPLRGEEDRETYLPNPEAFAALMRRAGIGNATHVAIYDDQGGRSAARLWYVLNAYGHERVSLVNGGWNKWVAEKRPVSTGGAAPAPSRFEPRVTPVLSCPSAQVLARKPGVVFLDTRSAAEYAGERPSGGGRGHIPGAVNVEWKENVTGPHLVFKPGSELKKLYESKGLTPDKEIVPY